jgi:hypothetical protein
MRLAARPTIAGVKTAFTAPGTATPDTSFRLFLQSELARRCKQRVQRSSARAIREAPLATRDYCSTMVAINSQMLPRAFQLIATFRQQLLQVLQEGPADDVYQVEVALFPLTTHQRDARRRGREGEVPDECSGH